MIFLDDDLRSAATHKPAQQLCSPRNPELLVVPRVVRHAVAATKRRLEHQQIARDEVVQDGRVAWPLPHAALIVNPNTTVVIRSSALF